MAIIAIDFDGTVVKNHFPEIGGDIGAVPVIRELLENKHEIILFSMRAQDIGGSHIPEWADLAGRDFLEEALQWFDKNNLPRPKVAVKKPHCDIFIDDLGLGIPLLQEMTIGTGEIIYSAPYVNWEEVKKILINKKYI